MIIGNSKGVNNRHIRFEFWDRAVVDIVFIWLSLRKCIVKILIGHKYYVKHLNNQDFEIFLVGQAVLQMSQISRSCVIASMRIQLNVNILSNGTVVPFK